AIRADHRRRPGPRTGAAALAARRRQLHGHLRLGPAQRVLEREVHLRLDVVAAQRLPPRARGGAAATAEDAAEQIADVADVEAAEVEVDVLAARTRAPIRRAETVVRLALLRVGEHVIRGLHLLEPLLGLVIAGIAVGV